MKISLINSLYKIGAIQFGEFTLKSGQTSKIYLDLRQIVSYPDILRTVSEEMWKQIHACSFDLMCGVPYTALPIATCLSLQHNVPMVMRRKEKKSYGTKKQIEGKFEPGQTCLIIEDVITSGTSILETLEDIHDVGLKTKDVVVLIDREQGGKQNLENNNLTVHAAFTLTDILQHLLHSTLLPEYQREIVMSLVHEKIK
jgi:orotate phosphoribosyltransferase